MNIWFYILLFIYILDFGIEIGKHGERETKEHNAFIQFIGSAIGITLLYLAVKTGL